MNRIKEKLREKFKSKTALVTAVIAIIVFIAVLLTVILQYSLRKVEENIQLEAYENYVGELLAEADRLALGYDFDAAAEKIKSFDGYTEETELTAALARYDEEKSKMVRRENVTDITHVFFHTLVVDTSKAFDGEYTEIGYNQYMTTVSEFRKMLEQMYAKGYVLVDIHDIAREQVQEDGTTKFVPGDIMLPKGKIPFVMSQDDVSYYNYMTGDGFASRIVIGDDGYPTCEYIQDDGSVVYGDYDLVPILESFINEHPDFSYRGARATLAITGYDGVLGYRTCPSGNGYNPDDIEKAKVVADRMKEIGWTFASHSWGHQLYGSINYEKLAEDAKKWNDEVKPILGDTDVLIYAHGEDIAGIGAYSGDKYELLKSYGFKYFCNVDGSTISWVQIRDGYVRQGRRNLDGYRMWYGADKLSDLFNVADVWDESRPTPVMPIG